MPNLAAHIDFAHQAAQRVDHPTLRENMGYFLLGSTSPDMRAITRRTREEYHFATLDFEKIGTGIEGLFHHHPHLEVSSNHDTQTAAFIAGYLTHLLVDETWIVTMFRPFFGNSDVFEDDVFGMVMDRALQIELDRQSLPIVGDALPLVKEANDGIAIDFIPDEDLHEWRNFVVTSLERDFSWERLRFMARRIAAGAESHPAYEIAEEFVQDAERGLERLYDSVPENRLATFRERCVDSLAERVGEYLE